MDIKIQDKEKNKKEIEIIVSKEEMEKYLEKAVKNLSLEVSIKGFRPGHVPKNILEDAIGKEKIWEEAAQEAIKESYQKTIKDNDFLVIDQPEIEITQIAPGNDFKYKAKITILPKIILPDYMAIAKEVLSKKREIKVDDKEVKQTIDYICQSRAKTKSVERGAKEKDEVILDFEGTIDNKKQSGLNAEKFSLILGQGTFFIDKFEDNIIGLKSGDEKDFTLKIPSKNTNESMNAFAGKEIGFKVRIHSVLEREVLEPNDEFAKSLGGFSDLKDLEEKLKANIKSEKEQEEKNRLRFEIIENIKKKLSFDVPDVLIEREINNMIGEFKGQLLNNTSGQNINADDLWSNYLKSIKKTEQDIKKEWHSKAEGRILSYLILSKIAENERIQVSDKEIEEETNKYLSHFPANQEAIEKTKTEEFKIYVSSLLRNEKVFQLLESK